jgi:flagellar biosynthesis/type III secretory pathway protein FliH
MEEENEKQNDKPREQGDLQWLYEKYKATEEQFRSSSAYQRILQAGRTEGIAIGKAEGIAIGEGRGIVIGKSRMLAQMRKKVMNIVIDDFPSLISLINEVIAAISDFDALFSLALNLVQAQGTKESEQILLQAQAAG